MISGRGSWSRAFDSLARMPDTIQPGEDRDKRLIDREKVVSHKQDHHEIIHSHGNDLLRHPVLQQSIPILLKRVSTSRSSMPNANYLSTL